MEKRQLGSSDLWVSVLGLGCWPFGGGSYWGPQSQQDVNQVVHHALDQGVNFFDTAEVYNDGASEISLGLALKGRREQAVIGSKISPSNLYPDTVAKHCDQSLQRLQTDYLDVYMLHWPLTTHAIAHFTADPVKAAEPPDLEEGFHALLDLQKQGKIRYIGVSNHGMQQMRELERLGLTFVSNELAYNLFSRAIEESILPYCVDKNIGIIGYMPLMQGLLTGKYPLVKEVKPMLARTRHYHHSRGEGSRHGEDGAEEEMEQALTEIRAIARELDVPITTLSLAWAVANKGMSTVIVGSRNLEQLAMNLDGANYSLPDEVVARLNRITEPVLNKLGNNADYYESSMNSRTH